MKIRYVGTATIRIVGDLRWAPSNNYVCEVGAEAAAELLTYPRPDFVVDAGEPLLEIANIDLEKVALLALRGIGTLADLARVDDAGRLATVLGVSETQVQAWRMEARSRMAPDIESTLVETGRSSKRSRALPAVE